MRSLLYAAFFELFVEGIVEGGAFWTHIQPWWQHRNDSNILFLFYEQDLQANLAQSVEKVATFLGVADLTEAELLSITQQSTFDAMRANDKSNITWYQRHADAPPFMRKGVVGAWRDECMMR